MTVDPRPRIGIDRIVAVLGGGALLLWLSLAVTLAMTTAVSQPRPVLALWPWAAEAKTVLAWDLLTRAPGDARPTNAATLAGAALTREPVSASAASALGTAIGLGGDARRSVLAFAYAGSLSRHGLQTQLWFIQNAVERGDVNDALYHYDIALRGNPTAGALLFPVLARASNDAAVRGPLLARLRRRPEWRTGYLQAMERANIDPVALAEQLSGAGLDPANESDARILSDGLTQLVAAGRFRLATAALPAVTNAPALRNGSFERAPALLPFDWILSDDSDLMAYRDPASMGQGAYVLRIASNARGGSVARQLVTLPPGRFMFDGLVGNTSEMGAPMPSATIACVVAHGLPAQTPLTTVTLDASFGGTRHFAIRFAVPARDCPAQWITVATPANATVSAWVDALRLLPATGQW